VDELALAACWTPDLTQEYLPYLRL